MFARICYLPDIVISAANGEMFGRVLFLRDYGSFIQDDFITSLMDFPRNMMLSIDIIPMGMELMLH